MTIKLEGGGVRPLVDELFFCGFLFCGFPYHKYVVNMSTCCKRNDLSFKMRVVTFTIFLFVYLFITYLNPPPNPSPSLEHVATRRSLLNL